MSQFSPLAYQKEDTLYTKQGIPLYLYPNPHLHSFSLCLYLRSGSIFESEAESGVTHAVEHLVFRNVNRLLGGKLYTTLDTLGLCLEGTTYKEFVQFSITGSPGKLREAVDIFSLLLSPFSVTGKDWLAEKKRIKAEIREESERTSLDFFADSLVHRGTAAARSIAGTAGVLDTFTLSSLEAARKRIFSKNNMFFYLTGNVNHENANYLLAKLGDFAVDEQTPKRENRVPVSEDFFKRNALVAVKSKTRHAVRLSIDVDTESCSDAELILLYDILFGDGEGCLLHKTLSEDKGYIYSFRAGMELYRNVAVISVSYEIPPSKLLPSVQLLADTLRGVKSGVGEALEAVRAPYTHNAEMMLDDAADLNWNRAYETKILGLPYESVAARAAAYGAVTEAQVTALAARLFRPENMTLAVGGRTRRIDTEALRAILFTV